MVSTLEIHRTICLPEMAALSLRVSRTPFGPFKHFLRLDTQCCNRLYLKTLEAYSLASHLTIAITSVINSAQRFFYQSYLPPLPFQFFKFDVYFSLSRSDIAKIRYTKPVVLEFISC